MIPYIAMLPTQLVDYPYIKQAMTKFLRGEESKEYLTIAFALWQKQNGVHLPHKYVGSMPQCLYYDTALPGRA